MGVLYILQSESTGRFYVGSTDHLARRFEEHQRGKSLATRGRGPWKLVYSEQFDSLTAARRREFEVKAWKSARAIHALIAANAAFRQCHAQMGDRVVRFYIRLEDPDDLIGDIEQAFRL